MAYNITGRSHKEGVKNEIKVANYLNKLIETNPQLIMDAFNLTSLEDIEFTHQGGTAHKSDLDISSKSTGDLIKEISIKKFNEGSTFDLVNTTKIDEYLTEEAMKNYSPLKDYLSRMQGKFKDKELGDEFKKQKKSEVKGKIEELTNTFLSSLSDHEIRGIISKVYEKDCEYLLITKFTKGSTGDKSELLSYFIVKKEDRADYSKYIQNGTLSLSKGRGLTSKQILVDGVSEGLRLRVVLNNGVNALLGFNWQNKQKNQSSTLTFKIQQDAPQKLIDESENVKTIE